MSSIKNTPVRRLSGEKSGVVARATHQGARQLQSSAEAGLSGFGILKPVEVEVVEETGVKADAHGALMTHVETYAEHPIPRMLPEETGGVRVGLTGRLSLLDSKSKVVEDREIGHVFCPTEKTSVTWLDTAALDSVTIDLAPAFAPLAGPWLDKAVLGALGALGSWGATSRSVEVSAAGRRAMREAAVIPLELTRYYVRLWAMWYSAAAEAAQGRAYLPVVSSAGESRTVEVETLSSWITEVGLSMATVSAPLMLDNSRGVVPTGSGNVMRLVTSERLENARLADWMWPPIPGCYLVHTGPAETVSADGAVTPSGISAVIGWLEATTGTKQQSNSARAWVSAMCMRPQGVGLCGGPAKAEGYIVQVGLPRTRSVAALLTSIGLTETTLNETIDLPTGREALGKSLVAAACAGQAYLSCLGTAAGCAFSQDWWPKRLVGAVAHTERSNNARMSGRWRLAEMVVEMLEEHTALPVCSPWIRCTAPRSIQYLRTADTISLLSWEHYLVVHDKIPSVSPASALFAKFTPTTSVTARLNRPMMVKVLGRGMSQWMVARLAADAGLAVGVGLVDTALSVWAGSWWAPAGWPGMMWAPDVSPDDRYKTRLIVKFRSTDEIARFWRLCEKRRNGNWYLEIANDFGPDEDFGDLEYDSDESGDGESDAESEEAGDEGAGGATGPRAEGAHGQPGRQDEPGEEHEDTATEHGPAPDNAGKDRLDQVPAKILELRSSDKVLRAMVNQYLTAADSKTVTDPLSNVSASSLSEWEPPAELVQDSKATSWALAQLSRHALSTQRIPGQVSGSKAQEALRQAAEIHELGRRIEERDPGLSNDGSTTTELLRAAVERAADPTKPAQGGEKTPVAGSSHTPAGRGSRRGSASRARPPLEMVLSGRF